MSAITDGSLSSASAFINLLNQIQQQGQSVLDDLETAYTETLFDFQQALESLNGRNIRAVRVLSPDVCCRFTINDFLDVDQSQTSGTIRADSQTGTLKEEAQNVKADILQTSFSSSVGTVQQFSQVYSVSNTSGQTPTGAFVIELVNPGVLSFLDFEIVSMPSAPTIQIYVSADGITETEATQVSQNGYVVNAWFPSQAVKYIRIELTPNMPDTLGGSTYSFGITNVAANLTEYVRYSEIVLKPITFNPVTSQVRFRTNDTGLDWFIQFGTGPIVQVNPGDILDVPGTEAVQLNAQINPSWQLCTGPLTSQTPIVLPADVYPSSIDIVDTSTNLAVRVAYGLDPSQAGSNLSNTYVGVQPYVNGGGLYVVPVIPGTYSNESGIVFQVNYTHGVNSLTAQLFVHLSGRNMSVTPVFRGAWLESLY